MPKVDVAVQASAAGLSKARSMTLSDGDVTRSTAALKAFYGQVDDGAGGLRDRTDAEAWDAFFDGVKRSLIDIVRKVETEQKASAAVDGVTEIAVT